MYDRKELMVKINEELITHNFKLISKDKYIVKYQKKSIEIQIFFGRYSDEPDIFIRYTDGDKPEQYSLASMMFIDEHEKEKENSLINVKGLDRIYLLLNFLKLNFDQVFSKEHCQKSKMRLDEYVSRIY